MKVTVFVFCMLLGFSAWAGNKDTYVCSVSDHEAPEGQGPQEFKIPYMEDAGLSVNRGVYRLWFVNGGGSMQVYAWRIANNEFISYFNIGWGTMALTIPAVNISCGPLAPGDMHYAANHGSKKSRLKE